MRPSVLKGLFSIALAATIATATSGCEQRVEGALQVVVIDGEPRLVEPQRGPLAESEAVLITNAAQGLVRFDALGQIEPGLAETWNVSSDGLSYIFRLANTHWPNGREVTAEQIARMLRRLIGPSSRNALRDMFGDIADIVAMTDRVIEIRLRQPQPHLLQLFAQPEMGLVYEGQGTGPFSIQRSGAEETPVRLTREVAAADEEDSREEELSLAGASAEQAVRSFVAGRADLVIGGTFADLPYAQGAKLPRRALQFDPASGLFGLVPARSGGLLRDPEVRELLSASIDREALVAAMSVPGLVPRTTVLEQKLDDMPDPVPPEWAATPLAERAPGLAERARRLFGEDDEAPVIRIALPEGPGSEIVIRRLAEDWGALGIEVERAGEGRQADLRLVDEVAPAPMASWFVRRFRCDVAAVCDEKVDEILKGARNTPVLAQRAALLAEAARTIDSLQLFIPIAAPIRWSLVSARVSGFSGNPFALHTLTGLEQQLSRTGE
jgi:oligopeptide transport system substrate-binding protein